ncbi:M43 family zinc metalloprotease [Fluviicola sp.]|uniref:M43 family zinc metalloprotease n=1 Tax=Fluviicola sp. TaxID=1917219 RepID=UPI00262B6F4D|nr:M43 family zinc metalloprotease [Fluviicola sp.]
MRKKLLLGVFSLIGMISTGNSFAQETHFNCGSSTQLRKLYAENPGLEEDYKKLVNRYKENRIINGKSTTVRIIPIVFHIVHEYGEENVSDQQIQNQMMILNRDYQKLNADTSVVIPTFDTIIGDAYLEFRLATVDPFGKCTNGIEHIYNHNTNQGDDYSKLHQWDRDKYLNVWLVKTIGSAGVAGYAYYPTGVTGTLFWRDGIIILHNYVGSNGTSNLTNSRALTHEIGHYLGLAHTWGNNNDPGNTASCNEDDGIEDTPNCIGMTSCNLNQNSCVDGATPTDYWYPNNVVDNAQNYMDYSYCSVMFTRGQCEFMRNVLDQPTSGRNNLYTADNLTATGTSTITPVTCVPVADFYVDVNGSQGNIGANANVMTACVNDPIAFKDVSWKAGVTSWEWSFPGGSPATSTSQNQNVTYAAPGWYDVTLKVTNSAGSDTKTINHMIYIQGEWAEYTGPRTEDFNQNANFWISHNPEDNEGSFHRVNTGGRGNTACFKLNNYKDISSALAFTEDWFYNDRLGNGKDYLVSPAFDLRSTSNVSISFDYAYGTKGTSTAEITEKLIVYSSRDCGKTWVQRLSLTGAALVTAGYVGNTDYTPNNDLQWKTATFNYTPNSTDNKTKFRFEFIASDFSSNFFFDNFNVSGTLGIEDNGLTSSISIAPNPVATGSDLTIEVPNSEIGMKLIVMDLNGAIVSTTNVPASSGTQTVNIPMNVAKGCYILNAVQGSAKSTHRVVVY